MKWVWVAVMALVALGGAENSLDSHATGNVTFIAQYPVIQEPVDIPNGTVIYAIKEVNTSVLHEKFKYRTTENGTIQIGQTEVTVPCIALDPGSESNLDPGELFTEDWMYMVSSVVNRDPIRMEEVRSSSVLTHF